MKLSVTLKVINPVVNGVSRATGNPYQIQDIVVEWAEPLEDGRQRSQLLKVKLTGVNVDKLAALCPVAGQTQVLLDLCFSTTTYNGRVINEVTAWLP